MTNSARYTAPDGTTVAGLLEEGPSGVAFRVDQEGRALFEVPYASIEKIATSLARPTRMKIVARGNEYPLELTGSVIDGEQHGEVEWQGSTPGEYQMTREERTAHDAAAVTTGLVKTVDYVAADRVRRGRLCKRILARRDGSAA
jgi:hypothetical protein